MSIAAGPTETDSTIPTETPAAAGPGTSETHRLAGEAVAARVKQLLHEGTVRRIVVKNDADHTVMEIPVMAGIVAAIVAPVLAAVGAVAALAGNWKIDVHRDEPTPQPSPSAN